MNRDADRRAQLHQSHLPGLTLPSQSADLHIPYLVRPDKGAFENAIGEWAQVCGAEVVTSLREGQGRRIVMLESGKGKSSSFRSG